jgi:aminopeptidase N
MTFIRHIYVLILLIFHFILDIYSASLPTRSDSVDVLHTDLYLDLTDDANQWINGVATITGVSKINNLPFVDFDLLKLQVDSIKDQNGNVLSFSYNDTLLRVILISPLNIGDTFQLKIFYQGKPQKDPSGWGGFYYQSGYIFNLGVGFQSLPHSYGRVWHPCFDNFVERSTYSFTVMTDQNLKAHCNGVLVNETIKNDTTIRQWELTQSIPSYLACVSAAEYATVHQFFSGINGNVPVELVAKPADTVKLKNSFVHLENAFDCFEEWFGPHQWVKIGYSLVPFSSGAMEHATNIAFPLAAANGTTTYEQIMAHELSHHWWGDLVTCQRAEEMWINEGWAEFASQLFFDCYYGHSSYLNLVRNNHRDVIHYAHLKEGNYWALDSIPQDYTYGDHVYNKGASVIHNLRTYLGDSLFKVAVKYVMQNFAFQNINSQQLQNAFETATGKNLQHFFDGWIYQGGFPAFSIDSFVVNPMQGNFQTIVFIKQKLKGANDYFQDVPIEISFYDSSWNRVSTTLSLGGYQSIDTVLLPFEPVFICLNENNGINQAVTDGQKVIKSSGQQWIGLSRMNVNVKSISDSALLRIEHHWTAPDPIINNSLNLNISQSRYFIVDGIWPANFSASAFFFYDARNILSGGNGNLDNDLVSVTEDSLLLLYRPDRKSDWIIFPYYTKDVLGLNNNKYGKITIDSLLKGEYTLANGAIALSHHEFNSVKQNINIYPNPANDAIDVVFPGNNFIKSIRIFNINGRLVLDSNVNKQIPKLSLNIQELTAGSYFVVIETPNEILQGKFVKKKN